MAVLDFVKNISNAIDKDMYTAGIFMDLSKAFDTINHEILLNNCIITDFVWCHMTGFKIDCRPEANTYRTIQKHLHI